MTRKKAVQPVVQGKTPLTQEEMKTAFHETWRSLRETISKELEKMKAGDVAVTASNVTAVTKFLGLTQATATDHRNAGLVTQPYKALNLPTFDDFNNEDQY